MPLPPTKSSTHREESFSVHRLPQKDSEIRVAHRHECECEFETCFRPSSGSSRCIHYRSSNSSGVITFLHPDSITSVAPPPPLTGRGTPPGQGRRWVFHKTWQISGLFVGSFHKVIMSIRTWVAMEQKPHAHICTSDIFHLWFSNFPLFSQRNSVFVRRSLLINNHFYSNWWRWAVWLI